MLSVVVPAYQEGRNIAANVSKLTEALDRIGTEYEVIVVSDGSTDNTLREAMNCAGPHVKVYGYTPNMGKGFALRYGFERSTGDPVTFIDADMELHPKEIGIFIKLMDIYMCDVVVGSKRHPQSEVRYPPFRRFQSWVYQLMIRMAFGLNVSDTQTGLKLFRREVLSAVLPYMLVRRWAYDLEFFVIARMKGYRRFIEAPVQMDYQFSSTTGLPAVFQVIRDTLNIWWRLKVRHTYENQQQVPLAEVREAK
ncbi:MAG TPA: glycosyltransferase family 2 protein [Candidatus Dormibacteraeota bacterium]|nr:glycosyltransferase family 2 protein [Candidatus Dormibacteraeota bacterium]